MAKKKTVRTGRGKNAFAFTMYITGPQRARLRALAKRNATTVVGYVRKVLALDAAPRRSRPVAPRKGKG